MTPNTTVRRRKKERSSLTDAQRRWLLGNTFVLAVTIALVPTLANRVIPWWWLALTGAFAFFIFVWGVILFFVKDDLVGWARGVLAQRLTLFALIAILMIEIAVFVTLASILPRADAPFVRFLPYGAFLSAPLADRDLLIVRFGDAATAFTNPKGAAVYIGDGTDRIAWRVSDAEKETRLLQNAAKATLTFLDEAKTPGKDVDRTAEIVATNWAADGPRVQPLHVVSGGVMDILLCPSNTNELAIYEIVDGTLKRMKRPLKLPVASEHTYIVMKEK